MNSEILQPESSRGVVVRCLSVSKSSAGGHTVLRRADLVVNKGELVVVCGEKASGKSLLLRLLLRLERPDRGQVWIEERNLAGYGPGELAAIRRWIGYIPQEPLLIARRTVFENVALPLLVSGKGRKEILVKVTGVLQSAGLAGRAGFPCLELSFSERKLAAAARAVVNDPLLLLADEPEAGLDEVSRKLTLELLRNAHLMGTTVVAVSNGPTLAKELGADRTLFLKEGRILEGSGAEMDFGSLTRAAS